MVSEALPGYIMASTTPRRAAVGYQSFRSGDISVA
jgi:hypothetical protein